MTCANLHIKLSDNVLVQCVWESSSAPEQGSIVEKLLFPLLDMNDSQRELGLLMDCCAMFELRANAEYRYIINLRTKTVHLFEEIYDCVIDKYYTGKNLTNRLLDYMHSTDALLDIFDELNIKTENQ
ncbi:MAG: penicillin-binding protein [Mucilaginibacter sp.]|nr:penicillin-binding protein [Mucilaginibacter sp.]